MKTVQFIDFNFKLVDLVAVCAQVKHWSTFNEPHIFLRFGYSHPSFPPDRHSNLDEYIAGTVVLKSHATAYRAYHTDFYSTQKGR